MLARVKSNPGSAALATQILHQWRHVPQTQPMNTMKTSISKMLLSTNQSRIVDNAHDTELRRGLKTSGDKQDYDEKNKPISQQMKEGAQDMKEKAKDNMNRVADRADKNSYKVEEGIEDLKDKANDKVNRMANRVDQSADRGSYKMQEMADKTKDNLNRVSSNVDDAADRASSKLDAFSSRSIDDFSQMEDTAQNRGKTQRVNMGVMEDSSEENKKDMRRVGNNNRLGGAPSAAGKRLEGASYGKAENVEERLGREKMDRDAAESYDVANRVKRETSGMSTQDMQPNRDIPGTNNPRGKNLRGTEDNFNDDPAISFGDVEDKIRETKEKITGRNDPAENMRKSMMGTGQGIRETVKGMTDAAKETVQNTATKTKEFLTGERESEKPDETKSEVRTADKKYPQNKGPSQPGSSEESTKW